MLEQFVGESNFRTSVTNYLNAHLYGNAVTDDLLTQIDNLNLGFDVKYIMSTWTKQMGYPVVNVEQVSPTQYKLTQKRFLLNPNSENQTHAESEFNYRWYIPITYTTDTQTEPKSVWFNNQDIEITLPELGPHKWLKLNKDQVGYYRVNYPINMWQALTDALIADVSAFSVSDRAHLLNDAFSLAEATHIKYDTALELTRYLAKETEYVPWSVASSKLRSLKGLLYYTDLYPKFIKYGQSVISAVYQSVGWSVGTDHLQKCVSSIWILNIFYNIFFSFFFLVTCERQYLI